MYNLNKFLNESVMTSVSRTKLKNEIYREMRKRNLGKRYYDEYWQGVADVKEMLGDVINKTGYEGDYNVYANNGGYRQSRDGMSQWKEYVVEIINKSDKIDLLGTLNCHACGKQDDPFSSYDMTLVIDRA